MNKRYMDFVPTKKASGEVSTAPKSSRPAVRNEVKLPPRMTVKKATTRPMQPAVRAKDEAELGVIENLGVVESKTETTPAKKVDLKTEEKPKKEASKSFQVPRNPFINQNKVEKRPLSKNVYPKKIVVPKEEPKGPVTIITKPEKDAHVSLIVAVILTIILGAAAGTVAFLLLPK